MIKSVIGLIDKIKAQIKTIVSFPLQRFVMALVCMWRGHKYIDGYYAIEHVRHWRQSCSRKGKHLYKEFQYECLRCKAKTRWKKWRYKKAFDKQHGLDW